MRRTRAPTASTPSAGKNGHVARPPLQPHWDAELRRLTVGGVVIKEYRVPAPNQVCVLAEFEKQRWRKHIPDPLPRVSLTNPKRRLHDVVRSLNRNQKAALIKFHADGTGRGIRWELLEPTAPGLTPDRHQSARRRRRSKKR